MAQHSLPTLLRSKLPQRIDEPKSYRVVNSAKVEVYRQGDLKCRICVNIIRIMDKATYTMLKQSIPQPNGRYDFVQDPEGAPCPRLSADEITTSFDMQQCAVAMHVNRRLRSSFTCSDTTLQLARTERTFSTHFLNALSQRTFSTHFAAQTGVTGVVDRLLFGDEDERQRVQRELTEGEIWQGDGSFEEIKYLDPWV
jgi:hypothetical protein